MRPKFSEAEPKSIVAAIDGFAGSVRSLPSYGDQNFLVDRADAKFVLKIANSSEAYLTLDFQHPAMQRNLQWDLRNAAQLHALLDHIKDSNKRTLVIHFLKRFEMHVATRTSALRMSVIHNDANDNNVLIANKNDRPVINGIIDFGDMLYSYTVCELAVTIAYMILDQEDPIAEAAHVSKGYHEVYPLIEAEVEVLFDYVCLRLCTSVCISARERDLAPDNAYLAISERPAWDALARLVSIEPSTATAHFAALLS